MLNEIWYILLQYKMLTRWQKGVLLAMVAAGMGFMFLIGYMLYIKP